MSAVVHLRASPSRWTAPREITRKSRISRSHLAPFDSNFAKVARIRGELATGCYPLDARLDAVLERILNTLSI